MLLEGDPAAAIVELAHNEGMNQIIMPTHGYGRFRRFILGSVTAKVLHDADCAVLTGVHLDEQRLPASVSFKNIVCAVDFDSAGENALKWAAEFASGFQAKLTVVHALPLLDDVQAHSYDDRALLMMFRQVAQENMDNLVKRVDTSPDVVLEPGQVAKVVHEAAISRGADLVVIGRHENPGMIGRLRENAYGIIRQSPCPVVSV
jgi:nucleotide-binding universal stress UspA family protein